MGATQFTRIGYGINAASAFIEASRAAQEEVGHQDGYSGDLNSKRGFVEVKPPVNVGVRDWEYFLGDRLPDGLKNNEALYNKHFKIYDDKWADAICMKLEEGKYLFCGWAPC